MHKKEDFYNSEWKKVTIYCNKKDFKIQDEVLYRIVLMRWSLLRSPRLGPRHRGRPGTRWADFFKKVAGVHWTRIAGNCNEWRHLGDTSNTRTRNHQYHPATIDVQQGQAVNQ